MWIHFTQATRLQVIMSMLRTTPTSALSSCTLLDFQFSIHLQHFSIAFSIGSIKDFFLNTMLELRSLMKTFQFNLWVGLNSDLLCTCSSVASCCRIRTFSHAQKSPHSLIKATMQNLLRLISTNNKWLNLKRRQTLIHLIVSSSLQPTSKDSRVAPSQPSTYHSFFWCLCFG